MLAASFFLLALPLFAAAGAVPPTSSGQCNTGEPQCCKSYKEHSSPEVTKVLAGLGVLNLVLGHITGQAGFTCSPIAGLVTGNSCNTQAVCCQNNSFNGVIAVGCTPINLNL